MKDAIARYFTETDCIVLGGRLYNIVYGKEPSSDDRLSFRGRDFPVFPGMLLDELETNLKNQNRQDIYQTIDEVIEQNKRPSGPVKITTETIGGAPYTLYKELAFELMQNYSMKDVLRPKKRENDLPLNVEAVLQEKQRVFESLTPSLSESIGQDQLLFIGGVAYDMQTCYPVSRASRNQRHLRIGPGVFRITGYSRVNPESIAADHARLIGQEIETMVRDSDALRPDDSRLREKLERIVSLQRHMDRSSNIGFTHNQRGFFIYTKTPGYILWEHEKDEYYSFPSAKVGVQLTGAPSQGTSLEVSKPVVMNRYKHPAIAGLNESYNSICFGHFDMSGVETLTPVKKIFILLNEGCRMLMENYCSDGNAYKNLEIPNQAELFKDWLVPASQVEERLVYNRNACIRRKESRLRKDDQEEDLEERR